MSRTFIYIQGADIDVKDDSGLTPLMFSVWGHNVNCVEWLVKAGADINAKDKKGWTALYWARVFKDDIENKDEKQKIISILEANGAKINISFIRQIYNFLIKSIFKYVLN